MIYLGALLAGMVGAVVGWFVTGVVTLWIAGLCGMSDFEGGRGMFAFLGVGPIGGLLGMIGAAWAVLRQRFGPLPGGGLWLRLVAVLAGIAILVAGGTWLRLATLDTSTDSLPPRLAANVAFLPTSGVTHESFVTQAWVDDPIRDVLERISGYTRTQTRRTANTRRDPVADLLRASP